MIKRAQDLKTEIREHMRGGGGQVEIVHLLEPGDYNGQARLCAKITLNKGCSIGFHDHVGEEEIFYLLSGEAVVTEGPDRTERPLRAGDVAVTVSGQGHAIRNDNEQPVVLVALILLTPELA